LPSQSSQDNIPHHFEARSRSDSSDPFGDRHELENDLKERDAYKLREERDKEHWRQEEGRELRNVEFERKTAHEGKTRIQSEPKQEQGRREGSPIRMSAEPMPRLDQPQSGQAATASARFIQTGTIPRFSCTHPDCDSSFGRRQQLELHMMECHGPPQRCPTLGCYYQTKRTLRLRKHLQIEHLYSHEGISNHPPFSSTRVFNKNYLESVRLAPEEETLTTLTTQNVPSSGQGEYLYPFNYPGVE
jgi:hypothetical protein